MSLENGPNGTLVLSYPNHIRRLVTRPLFRSRARVALGSELRLLMSFSWPVFPGLDQDLFPSMVFLVFWDSKGSAYLEFLLRKFAAACGVAAEQEVK